MEAKVTKVERWNREFVRVSAMAKGEEQKPDGAPGERSGVNFLVTADDAKNWWVGRVVHVTVE